MLTENKFSKYLLYAIGEIILVVIGILIALQVNNQNNIRNEKQSLKNYLSKISKNVNDDIEVGQFMLKNRTEQSVICAEATDAIASRDFNTKTQTTITNAVFAMIIEQPINFNRSGFESLKNSGYLQYLDNSNLEDLIYKYYNITDKILFEETSCQVWANDLDLEFHKNGFFTKWLQLLDEPNQKLTEVVGNYTDELYQHPGNDVVISLLHRGFLFDPFLTDWYKEQTSIGKELLTEIENYNKE